MWSVHTAYLIRISQKLEIGACGVLVECVTWNALEVCKRGQIFGVDTDNLGDSKSHIKWIFHDLWPLKNQTFSVRKSIFYVFYWKGQCSFKREIFSLLIISSDWLDPKLQIHEHDSYLYHNTFIWEGFTWVSTFFFDTHGIWISASRVLTTNDKHVKELNLIYSYSVTKTIFNPTHMHPHPPSLASIWVIILTCPSTHKASISSGEKNAIKCNISTAKWDSNIIS